MGIEEALERCAMFGVKPGLARMRAVCAALGDPQDAVRTVHVAGTNGKGATCALIDSALRASGLSVGRYTSPHLVSLEERFLLNGSPVPMRTLDRIHASLPDTADLTYFELLTAVAFELYRRERTDWLVLETGLGGRLDATNVVKRPELCVITRIGLDHCDWLGGTPGAIASEKGGIIKEGVPVVLGAMPDEARGTLERIAAERGARCVYAPDAVPESAVPDGLSLRGKFNRENAVTALAALDALGIGRDAAERGFAAAVWPGRFQETVFDGKRFIVDGAHNPPAMRALVDALGDMTASAGGFPVRSAICGFCGDKDVSATLSLLRETTDSGIAVAIRNPRSLPAAGTARLMRGAGFREVRECASVAEALSAAPDGTVVCGSLFLAGEALEAAGAVPARSGGFTPNESFSSVV